MTVPAALSPTLLSAVGTGLYCGLPCSIVEIPSLRGLFRANGRDPIRVVTKGAIYDLGLLASSVAPTLASGTAASTRLNTDEGGAYTIVEGNFVTLIVAGAIGYRLVFRLAMAGVYDIEIFFDGTTANALVNLKKFINATGVDGVDYRVSSAGSPFAADIRAKVSAGTLTSTDLTLTARASGTAGNSYACTWGGGGGPVFEQESTTTNQTLFSGGTDASGSAPGPGTFRAFYTSYRDADGAESGPSPIASVSNSAGSNISASVLTANQDTTADYTRYYRTQTLGVEFYLTKTIARSGTTATDDVSDTDLVEFGNVPFAPENFRSNQEGMPPRGRALAMWKGRLWTGGAILAAEYSRGTASVTVGSASVTMSSGCVPSQMWVGRTFQVDSTSEKYTIIALAGSTKIITLDREYVGGTNGTATYTVRDTRDPCAVYCSVSGLYNLWPVDNNLGRVDTDDSEGITAFGATQDALFAFTPTTITRITGEDIESWQMQKAVDGVGCVAERCLVSIAGGFVFLSRTGIYAWGGVGEPQPLSSPPTRRGRAAIGIEDTIARISWANVRQAFATYNRELGQVRFAVPLDGAECPNHEIVLDLQNQTWALYRRAQWTASCPIVLPGGGQAILAGDRDGLLWHTDLGDSDGAYGFEPVQTLTGAQTKRVLTTDGTALPTSGDGLKGVPVLVIYANGTDVAVGKVASNTSAAVTLAEDLATAPAAADQIVLGGIWWRAKTGFYSGGSNHERTQWRDTTVSHIPIASGDYHYAFAVENGTFAIPTQGYSIGDPTAVNGRRRFRNQKRAMNKADLFQGFKPGPAPTIRGVTLSIGRREEDGL